MAIDRDFRLHESGRVLRAKVGSKAMGSIQAVLASGTWAEAVLEAVVSDDPTGNRMDAHPSAITLAPGGTSAAFAITGYVWYGVRVKTPNTAEAYAEVSLRGC